jgi:drug/metabolite transporter (DMT)-like permease
VPTDITTQVVSRLLTYTVLGFTLAKESDVSLVWGSSSSIFRSLLLGTLTLIHIGSSYLGYKELPAGVAQSIFYVYPILNLIGGAIGFGEQVSLISLALILFAFLGVVLVATSKDKTKESKTLSSLGLSAVSVAALTETLTYFAVRTAKQPSPFFAVIELYPAAFVGLLAYLGYSGQAIDTRPAVWLPMIVFNTLIGFVGYCLRFYAIPRLPTVVFSLLSFIGVLASFLWGYIFIKEIPTSQSLLGATLITGAVGASRFFGMK